MSEQIRRLPIHWYCQAGGLDRGTLKAITESSCLSTYRYLDRADRRARSCFSSVVLCLHSWPLLLPACVRKSRLSGVKHIWWERLKPQWSSSTAQSKGKANLPELETDFFHQKFKARVSWTCTIPLSPLFFFFLFGSDMNTQSTPFTTGITWCWVIFEYFTFLHPQVSAQPFCGFSLRGVWRLKGAGGSLWAPPPEERGLLALQASSYAHFTHILFQSIILSPCYTLFLFQCALCPPPASLLFFNENRNVLHTVRVWM